MRTCAGGPRCAACSAGVSTRGDTRRPSWDDRLRTRGDCSRTCYHECRASDSRMFAFWKRSPHPAKLAAMTAHFNPAGYGRLRENYAFFAERLAAQGVDLWTVEVAFGAEPHALPAHERCLQLRTDPVLWLKERALNVLLAPLPSAHDAVAWLDADILFDDNIWTEDRSE